MALLQAPGAPARPTDEVPACVNCGSAVYDAYCGACGQRRATVPFRLRVIGPRLLADAFDVNQGLLHTALSLVRRPGGVVQAYVSGATVRFTNPAKYLLLCVTLAQLAAWWSGTLQSFVAGFGAGRGTAGFDGAEALQFARDYFVVFAAMGLPFLAASTRLVFRSSGRSYGEHLVFGCFVFAQQNLFFAVYAPVAGRIGTAGDVLMGVWMVLHWAHFTLAASQFFRVGPGTAFARMSAALALGVLMYAGGLAGAARLLP
jgi:hypothetical protein